MCKSTVDTSTTSCQCDKGSAVDPLVIPVCGPDSICNALDKFVEGANYETNKGFCTVHVINFKEGTTHLFGVAYKIKKRDKGVMLNYCPFCGGQPGEFKRG